MTRKALDEEIRKERVPWDDWVSTYYHNSFVRRRWDEMTDTERAKTVRDLVDELGQDFNPAPFILDWLMRQAGVR